MWHRLFLRLIPPLCLSNEYGVTEQSASLAINYVLSRGPHKPTNICASSVWRAEILMINEKRRGSYNSSGLPTNISPREFYLDLLQYLPRSLTKESIWQDHAWMPLDWLWSLRLSFLFLGPLESLGMSVSWWWLKWKRKNVPMPSPLQASECIKSTHIPLARASDMVETKVKVWTGHSTHGERALQSYMQKAC